jgi:hypothetical protein
MQKSVSKIWLFIIGIAIVACTEVSFPVHQPKGESILTEFPLELRGRYVPNDADSTRDTIMIDRNSYRIISSEYAGGKDWLDHAQLSDSLVLKQYKGFYFINIKENNQWLLRVLKRKANGDLSFRMLSLDGRNEDKLRMELNKETPVNTIKIDSSTTYHQINPSPKKLLTIIKKKKFWNETELKKIR